MHSVRFIIHIHTPTPDYGRTVTDPKTGKEVKLTDEEVDLIKRVQVWISICDVDMNSRAQSGLFPEPSVDPYPPTIEYLSLIHI